MHLEPLLAPSPSELVMARVRADIAARDRRADAIRATVAEDAARRAGIMARGFAHLPVKL